MSSMHVHNCTQLVDENEKLKRLIKKIKRENDGIKEKLKTIEEREKFKDLLKQYVTTRDVQVQTEGTWLRSGYSSVISQSMTKKKPSHPDEGEKINKMLVMHNNLMKRYEKELKSNMEHVETITKLNLRVTDLERIVKDRESEVHELTVGKRVTASQRAVSTGRRSRSTRPANLTRIWLDSSQDSTNQKDVQGLLKEMNKIRSERDKLVKDKRKLKDEIRGLDHSFFDEIEDLKFALHKSAKLNQEYEQALHKVCHQFGVPFPPRNASASSSSRDHHTVT